MAGKQILHIVSYRIKVQICQSLNVVFILLCTPSVLSFIAFTSCTLMGEHPVNICAMHDKKMSTVLFGNFASFLSLHTDDEHVD